MSHSTFVPPGRRPVAQARLVWRNQSHTLATSIDSGSDISIIDEDLARRLRIDLVPLSPSVAARALDGRPLATITHRMVPVQLLLAGDHYETIQLHVLRAPHHPLVLGFPWLLRHSPQIDWSTGAILKWSAPCRLTCLQQGTACPQTSSPSQSPDLSGVPEEYHDLREVFSKARATVLPPHRPYDCAIDLLPGTTPPRGSIYSISGPERETMDKYLNESLAAGLIRHLSSLLQEQGSSLWRRRTRH